MLTPGTATGASLDRPKENNFLAAVARSQRRSAAAAGSGRAASRETEARIGLAFVDLSTGEFRATEFTGEKAEARLRDELGILRPREILLARPAFRSFQMPSVDSSAGIWRPSAVETRLDDWIFESNYAARQLEQHFHVVTLEDLA